MAASLWDLPLVRTPKLDSAEYLSWAQRLASGDWAWPLAAQHGPGYPLFLAALLVLGSNSLRTAIAAQALLGACTAALIAVIARRWFGDRVGLFAGLAYALYGPVAYIDTAILAEGLLLFLLAAALCALSREPLSIGAAAVAGAAFGAAALVRPTALIIAAACVLWILIVKGRASIAPGRNTVGACVMVACCFAAMAPALARNWSTSGTFSIQGYGGLNAYIGNSPLHDGRATFRLGAGWDALNAEAPRAGISDPAEQDRYYLSKTGREIAQHPWQFVRLLGSKALWLIQAEEPRDSHSYYFFTEQAPLLRILPRWSLLFPLACVGGFVLCGGPLRQRGSSLWLFYSFAAAASVVFLVVGFRYRMPLVPAVAIAAGVGVDAIASAAAARRTRELGAYAAAIVAALGASHVLSDPRHLNAAEEWAFTGSSLITEHRLDEAEAAYRHALALDPRSGLAWDGFGLTMYNAGRLTDARSAFERAIAIDPDSSRAIFHLGLVDEREGRSAEAAERYQRALELSPFDADVTQHLADARRSLATELGMSGRTREARDAMRRVLDLTPGNGEAWLDLCLLSLDLGDADTAAAALQRARERGADPTRLQFAADALSRLRGR